MQGMATRPSLAMVTTMTTLSIAVWRFFMGQGVIDNEVLTKYP